MDHSQLLEEILPKVIAYSKEAGDFIRTESQHFDSGKIEIKGKNDLVSYVDKEAEKMLVEGLQNLLPEAGFITEEGTATHTSESFNWIIDPLDGTTNFIHGLPIFAVSVGLTFQKEVVLGVIYEVNRDECFHAIKGKGAFCNDQPIATSNTQDIADSLLSTGFPYYDFGRMQDYLVILNNLMKSCHGLRRMGSAAVDLAYVACGRCDAFFEYNLNSWDIAAGTLIVQEAGGIVTDYTGGNDFLFGRELIAANKGIHQAVLDEIMKNW